MKVVIKALKKTFAEDIAGEILVLFSLSMSIVVTQLLSGW